MIRKIIFKFLWIPALLFWATPSMAAIYTGGFGEGYGYAQGNSGMYYGGNGEGYGVIAMVSDTDVGYNVTATQLTFTTSPSNSYAGAAFGTQPIVAVEDTYGNTVLSATNNVTLSINNDPVGSSTLGGTTSMAAVAGVANFSGDGVYVSRAGTPYTLQAAASGLSPATSSSFTSSSPVQLSSPWTGAQSLNVNTQYTISWNTYGTVATGGNNTIQYSLNNGFSWTTLETTPATSGSSSYTWTTPSSSATQAEVRVVNSVDSTFTNTSAVFTLSAGLTVTSPISSSVWASGFSHNITWTSSGTVSTVNLYYSTSSSGPWTLINTGGAISNSGSGSYSWMPPTSLGGTYYVKVADANGSDSTNPGISSAFAIQTVSVNNIVSGERVLAGSSLSIPWTSSNVSAVSIQYTLNGTSWTTMSGASSLSSSSNSGTYSWTVPSTTSNLVQVRVTSTAADTDGNYAISTSAVFTLYGVLTINTPASTAYGTAVSITWSTSPSSSVADVNLYYTTNGSTWTLINTLGAVANTNSYSLWTPSATGTTYQVEVVDANDPVDSSASGDFTVTGIDVSSPSSASSWACGSSQTISWNYTGSLSSFTIQYYNGSSLTTIASSIGGSSYCSNNSCSYTWNPVPNVPVINSYIQINSGATTGTSSTFNIPAAVTAVSINSGQPLNVGSAYNITWTPAAGVTNVELQYSINSGSTWNTIVASTANSTGTSGYSWTIPNAIGAVLVRISDADSNVPTATAQASFTIQPNITITSPTSGVSWAVYDPSKTITWTNTGTVSNVELYYATSPYSSWTSITTVANSGSYSWSSVPDILLALGSPQTTPTLPVELKVVDTASGASAVSSPFNVIYYTTTWVIEDSQTHNLLANLSVSDTSGWSASSLASGVTHNYPYGTYTTIWSKDSYSDSSYANWVANQNQTLTVNMILSAVAGQAYDVYSNFTYDATSSSYLINSWIEQAGAIVLNPTSCTVTIVDSNDNVVSTLSSSSPDSNGVFRQSWSLTGLNPNSSYLGKAQIVYQGSTYSANAVYSISVPSVATVAAVTSLGSQFSNFATSSTAATTAISTSVGSNLTGQVTTLQTTANTISTGVSGLQTTDSDVLASVGSDLATQVSGLQTTDSNILTSVGSNLTGQVSGVDSDLTNVVLNPLVSDINTVGGNVTTLNNLTKAGGAGDLAAILSNASTAATQSTTAATMSTDLYNILKANGAGDAAAILTTINTLNNLTKAGGAGDLATILTNSSNAATGVSAVQTTANNISTSVGSNLTGQVTSIANTLSSLSTLTTTINSLLPQLNNLATTVTTINTLLGSASNPNSLYGKLATINTNVNTLINDWGTYKASDIVNNANTVAAALGNPVDSCGLLTVFGKINCIYNQGGNIESTSALANQTYSSIQQLQQQIGSKGKSVEAYHLMQNIGVYTNGLETSVGVIPQNTVQPELFQISQNVQAAQRTLAKTSSQAGITSVVPSQGTQVSPVTLDNLHQELLELKQMTELVKNTVVSKEGPQVKAYFENGSTGK